MQCLAPPRVTVVKSRGEKTPEVLTVQKFGALSFWHHPVWYLHPQRLVFEMTSAAKAKAPVVIDRNRFVNFIF
jgi:hypothetical protein